MKSISLLLLAVIAYWSNWACADRPPVDYTGLAKGIHQSWLIWEEHYKPYDGSEWELEIKDISHQYRDKKRSWYHITTILKGKFRITAPPFPKNDPEMAMLYFMAAVTEMKFLTSANGSLSHVWYRKNYSYKRRTLAPMVWSRVHLVSTGCTARPIAVRYAFGGYMYYDAKKKQMFLSVDFDSKNKQTVEASCHDRVVTTTTSYPGGKTEVSRNTYNRVSSPRGRIYFSIPFKAGSYQQSHYSSDRTITLRCTKNCPEQRRARRCQMAALSRSCNEIKTSLVGFCKVLKDWMVVYDRSDRPAPSHTCATSDCRAAIEASRRRGNRPFTSVSVSSDLQCTGNRQLVCKVQCFGWH